MVKISAVYIAIYLLDRAEIEFIMLYVPLTSPPRRRISPDGAEFLLKTVLHLSSFGASGAEVTVCSGAAGGGTFVNGNVRGATIVLGRSAKEGLPS